MCAYHSGQHLVSGAAMKNMRVLTSLIVLCLFAASAEAYSFDFQVKSEAGLLVSSEGPFYTFATLYRVDESGTRQSFPVASSNCWSDAPWEDGCIYEGGYGRFGRSMYGGGELVGGLYELSVKAEAHTVARVRFRLPLSETLNVKLSLVPVYMQVASHMQPNIPASGGNLEQDITFWNFKSSGIVSVQVFIGGPSRTTESTMYARLLSLPLSEAGTSTTHKISVPIAGDLPNGAVYCATVRAAHQDRPEDEYHMIGFCAVKGDPPMIEAHLPDHTMKK